jgi:uncharacterized protein YbjT (DUF2867 family)
LCRSIKVQEIIMIVVTTPTGFIGSKLVRELLAAREAVRVIARDPDKLPDEVRAQVEIVRGSSDDESVLDPALAGAESLFHVVPPFFAAPDVMEYYLQFTRPVIRSMKRHGVARVVTVSGIGRRRSAKAGPVSATIAKDLELERAGLHVRALWCPSFMENTLRSVESLRTLGTFAGPSRPDVKAPLVATCDIAAVGARLLRDRSWTGGGGVAVLGPEDLSIDDRAAILSEVLARPIRYQQVPTDAYAAQLMKYGASEGFARGLLDMHAEKDGGLDLTEPRTPENTTPTSFRQWCTEVLVPALRGSGS